MPVSTLDPSDLERIRPLWLALHAHHRAIAPQLAPYADDDASWHVRRAYYQDLLARGGVIFTATEHGHQVAYASADRHRMPWSATFRAQEELIEIASLFVTPEHRGSGVASQLLDEIDVFGHACGLNGQMVGVVHGNEEAARLYARRGFKPAWLTLTRFGRDDGRLSEPADILIEKAAPDEVSGLRELWLEVHRHHSAVSPELAPFVSDDASWAVFEPIFRHAASAGLLLRAGPRDAPVGLACTEITGGRSDFSDTWTTGPFVAEIEVMAVSEQARGKGIGSALLARILTTLEAAQVSDCCVGAIAGNKSAIRLYERAGFRPAWHEMTKLTAA